jgi:DNA-binding transcriptional MerR regulator
VSAPTLNIQQAATVSKVSPHTLRYYERIGLLPAIARDSNGYRQYSEYNLGAVNILLRLRDTGMPIQGMKRFAELLAQGDSGIPERLELLEAHEKTVREKIRDLETNLELIEAKINLYRKTQSGISPNSRSGSRLHAGGSS